MAPFVQEIVQIKRPMSTTKYISPALPTAAGNAARHPLIGTDLWPMHMVRKFFKLDEHAIDPCKGR